MNNKFTYATYSLMTANLLLNLVFSTSLSILWSFMLSLQQLAYLSLISLQLRGLPLEILKLWLQIAQMEIIPSDKVYEVANIEFDEDNDRAFNSQFQMVGISSLQSLNNLGSTNFLLIVVNIFVSFIVLFVKIVSMICTR